MPQGQSGARLDGTGKVAEFLSYSVNNVNVPSKRRESRSGCVQVEM